MVLLMPRSDDGGYYVPTPTMVSYLPANILVQSVRVVYGVCHHPCYLHSHIFIYHPYTQPMSPISPIYPYPRQSTQYPYPSMLKPIPIPNTHPYILNHHIRCTRAGAIASCSLPTRPCMCADAMWRANWDCQLTGIRCQSMSGGIGTSPHTYVWMLRACGIARYIRCLVEGNIALWW